ncbi:MAG: hypothetical protein ACRDPA_20995, partial [Solirubrobacteraceae bacterium]
DPITRPMDILMPASAELCPACRAPMQPDQRYCLECGLALPLVSGRLAGLRRRWIARVGWYPGDWVWASLLTLVIAIAGAAAAIALSHDNGNHGTSFIAPITTATPPITTTPITTAPTTTAPTTSTTTAKAPAQPVNGRFSWPATENGWTIVLVSYPKTTGHDSAVQTAARAAKAGLTQVGVLDSSLYASLQPGYYVVFTGIYGSKSEADAAVTTARQAGFGGAYSRQIAR